MHSDQAIVTGCVGWSSQTGAIGRHRPNRHFEQATHNGGCAEFNMARVAGTTAKVTRRTSTIWVDVKPAKVYRDARQSDSDSGIAEVMISAYFEQPSQLQPAASTQVASSFTGYPPPEDIGTQAGSAPS